MYTSLDTQGRLSARLLSAQARSACLFFLLLLLFSTVCLVGCPLFRLARSASSYGLTASTACQCGALP